MQIVNIYQAKTQLSKLVQASLDGKEVIIAKAGKPVVRVVPFKPNKKDRVPGLWAGKVEISPDFDDEDEEINKMFYGTD